MDAADRPSPQAQLAFLQNIQRLLDEGLFTATYKYALLLALADVCVERGEAWALFPHPVQTIKREHTARCRRRWGVTARTSGWELFRRSWCREVAAGFGCLAILIHAWWFGLGD